MIGLYVQNSGKSVQTVSDRNINGFTEYSISLMTISNDLSVTSAHIQNNRIFSSGDESTHFYVFDIKSKENQKRDPIKRKQTNGRYNG